LGKNKTQRDVEDELGRVLISLGFTPQKAFDIQFFSRSISSEVMGNVSFYSEVSRYKPNTIEAFAVVGISNIRVTHIGMQLTNDIFAESWPSILHASLINFIPSKLWPKYRLEFTKGFLWENQLLAFSEAISKYCIPWMNHYPDFAAINKELEKVLNKRIKHQRPIGGFEKYSDPIILALAGKRDKALKLLDIERARLEGHVNRENEKKHPILEVMKKELSDYNNFIPLFRKHFSY
jgi:hypothetical protein